MFSTPFCGPVAACRLATPSLGYKHQAAKDKLGLILKMAYVHYTSSLSYFSLPQLRELLSNGPDAKCHNRFTMVQPLIFKNAEDSQELHHRNMSAIVYISVNFEYDNKL